MDLSLNVPADCVQTSTRTRFDLLQQDDGTVAIVIAPQSTSSSSSTATTTIKGWQAVCGALESHFHLVVWHTIRHIIETYDIISKHDGDPVMSMAKMILVRFVSNAVQRCQAAINQLATIHDDSSKSNDMDIDDNPTKVVAPQKEGLDAVEEYEGGIRLPAPMQPAAGIKMKSYAALPSAQVNFERKARHALNLLLEDRRIPSIALHLQAKKSREGSDVAQELLKWLQQESEKFTGP